MVAGTGPAQDNQAPEGDYFNPEIGIKVHLPEGWKIVMEKKPDFGAARAAAMKVGTLATLLLVHDHTGSSAQAYRAMVEEELGKNPDFQVTGQEPAKLDGLDGERIAFKYTRNKTEMRGWMFLLANGDQHYRIGALAPSDTFNELAPAYTAMLQTVRFAQLHTDEKFASTVPVPDSLLPQRIRVAPDVAAVFLVRKVTPKYPHDAEMARIQGTVVVAVVISKSGDVHSLHGVRGHPMLLPAAIQAIQWWKYKPYLLNGNPVEVETTVEVHFRPGKDPW